MKRLIGLLLILLLVGTLALALADVQPVPAAGAWQQGPTPTPDPYAGLSINDLVRRSYGAGALTIEDTLGVYPDFTRYLIAYPSDELTIYGFMNMPTAPGLYPTIIAVHGYIDPSAYNTLDYTTRYADDLARAGFVVLHPNLRGYFPSSSGPNLFRVGMAVDVLNLAALVRQQGNRPGPLQAANPERLGLWGHSMGGGISLRAITVDPQIDAAVLYAAMSGDDEQNFAAIREWSGGERGLAELNAPAEAFERISPIFHLDRIRAAVSVHHGEADALVPLDWSINLCGRLLLREKDVTCFTYPEQPHTFRGEGDRLFVERTIDFFNLHLRP